MSITLSPSSSRGGLFTSARSSATAEAGRRRNLGPAGGRIGKRDSQELEAALRRIELTYDETLRALGAALDLRDTETAGHSERVTRYTLQIARQMNCPSDELIQITRGAYLHDVGKIGIPDSVLLKEDKLDSQETELMKTHVRIGYNLVSQIAFLAPAAEIVLAHHEFFDGSGYPQGLREKEIPWGARIFSVADTLDAITSDRPYRSARAFPEARDEIEREAGRQFDPEVVAAFLSIPEQAIGGTVLEEKRRYARVGLRTLVACRLGRRVFFPSSCDVSESGISLSPMSPVDIGRVFELEFDLPNDPDAIRARAKVVRWESSDRMAARFVKLALRHRRQISRYIAERIRA